MLKLVTMAPGYGWGVNDDGQLGNNSTDSCSRPCLIDEELDFTMIAAGLEHTIGLTKDGTAYAWGSNDSGQLGINSNDDVSTPTMISGNYKFIMIGASDNDSSYGLTKDGDVYAWGYNEDGQLGIGTVNNVSSPVMVNSDVEFKSISVGSDHVIALSKDGDAYAWGNNEGGQIGDGSDDFRSSPVAVIGNLKFVSISAGGFNSFGITRDGTAYAWGDNPDGSLGINSEEQIFSPVKVYGDLKFSMISAGYVHTLGLTTDGSIYSWGHGYYGKLGNNSDEDVSTPTLVASEFQGAMVSAGFFHSLALDRDGFGYAWGWNSYGGALGVDDHGAREEAFSPFQIDKNMKFSSIHAGKMQTSFGILKKEGGLTVRVTCYDKGVPTDPEDYTVKIWDEDDWVEVYSNPLIIPNGIVEVHLTDEEIQGRSVISIKISSSNTEDQIVHFYIEREWTKERALNITNRLSSRLLKDEYSDKMDYIDMKVSEISDFDPDTDVVMAVDQDGNVFASKDDVRDEVIDADLSEYEKTAANGITMGDLIVSSRAGIIGRMKVEDGIITLYRVNGNVPIFTATLDDIDTPTERSAPND